MVFVSKTEEGGGTEGRRGRGRSRRRQGGRELYLELKWPDSNKLAEQVGDAMMVVLKKASKSQNQKQTTKQNAIESTRTREETADEWS